MRIRTLTFGGLLVTIMAGSAAAQEPLATGTTGLENFAGGLFVAVPDYEGSEDFSHIGAPMVQIRFHDYRWVRLTGNRLSVNLMNHENWEFGPLGVARFERDHVDNGQVDAMTDVKGALELGGFFGYTMFFDEEDTRQRLNFRAGISHDTLSGHDGWEAIFETSYWHPLGDRFDAGVRVSTSLANDEYTSTYFDVDAIDAGLSGLPQYNADGGIKDVGVQLTGLVHLTEQWHMVSGAAYRRMVGDAADSPVVTVGSENQFYMGVGFLYSWQR